MAISGKLGAVFVQADAAPVSFSNEPMADTGDGKTWRITDASKAYWAPDFPALVEVSDDDITYSPAPDHRIELGGHVVFAESQAGRFVRVSGQAVTLEQAGGFYNWSLDLEGDDEDATTFASAGWKEFRPTLKGFSGSAEAYWGERRMFDALQSGESLILAFYVERGASLTRFEGLGIITGDNIDGPVDGIVAEQVNIKGTGPIYYREG